MHKLCYLILFPCVIKIALGDVDETDFKCICTDSNGTLFIPGKNADTHQNGSKCICPDPNEEFITPIADKNYIFSEPVSTPTIDEKTLQRLDLIVGSLNALVITNANVLNKVKVLIKENEKIVNSIASLNSIEAIIKNMIRLRNCNEARSSGIYEIQVSSQPFKVYCEEELFDGGWTVVARRMDGTVNFTDRNWAEYKDGFGDLSGEFFIGLDKLYALTNGEHTQELIFVLRDFEKNQKYAKYSEFAIEDESEGYKIKTLGYYSGNAGDSFSYHRDQTFKTKDRDTSTKKCTEFGAWWYNDCHWSNLFGSYLKEHYSEYQKGVEWSTWRYNYSLKFAQMMIRPRKC